MFRQQRPARFGVLTSSLLVMCVLAGACSSSDDPADTADMVTDTDAASDTEDSTAAVDGTTSDDASDAADAVMDSDSNDAAGTDTAADAAVATQCSTDADCAAFAGPCRKARCGNAGFCVVEEIADGTDCDDDAPCTVLDRCNAGLCKGPPRRLRLRERRRLHRARRRPLRRHPDLHAARTTPAKTAPASPASTTARARSTRTAPPTIRRTRASAASTAITR